MTTPLGANTGAPELGIREPTQAELERALHLFHGRLLPPQARLLAAVRTRPIERFVAAAAWWPEGTIARFQLASHPGATRAGVAGLLVEGLAECARRAGMEAVHYADLLPAEHEWAELLIGQGFERLRSERHFEVPQEKIRTRITRLYQRHQADIPRTWRTEPIRLHQPEVILDLIAPHRLLPPEEVRRSWQPNAVSGFELDLSCILFDRERVFGTLLSRHFSDLLYVEVQVVHEANPGLRSLADMCLIYHDALQTPADGPIRRIQFRSGETEHRQTANLALRMGGRELPPRHVFARKF